MKSIYFRNFIITAGLVITCFLVLAVAFVVMGRSFLASDKRASMNDTAKEIVESTRIVYDIGENAAYLDLRKNINQMSVILGYQIFITDAWGVVKNCSDNPYECSHIDKQMPADFMQELEVTDGLHRITDLGGFYRTRNYVTALPVRMPYTNSVVAYVFVASEVSALLDGWTTFLYMFAVTATLVMLIAVVMAYVASKQQSRPINEMAAAARLFAHGDFSARVTEDSCRRDEIGELTAAFNAMADTLERSEELRSEFIANVSHELKTPMTTIAGFADGILDGTIPPENQEKYLRTISEETRRLSRLVRSMLELSRIQASGDGAILRNEFDITETLMCALINFEGKVNERGLSVDIQIPENSIIVMGDGDAIMQVVYNLLDNAIKFSLRGSTLGISLWRQGAKAYVAVKNAGETIPPEELAQIFERFHKTDRSRSLDREGVGLGLYIVKTILNNHNEDIMATSRDGVTEFIFSLTLKPQTGRHLQSAKTPQQQLIEPEAV